MQQQDSKIERQFKNIISFDFLQERYMPFLDQFEYAKQIGGVTRHFHETLRAPLRNQVWSWSAYSEALNCVVLKFTGTETETLPDGRIAIKLAPSDGRPGAKYLKQDLMLVHERNAKIIGVMTGPKPTFDKNRLVILDRPITSPFNSAETLVPVIGVVPTSVFLSEANMPRISDIESDINEIRLDKSITNTTRQTLIEARIGQGTFRLQVLANFDGKCAVTGCTILEVLRASHIKPWRECNNEERLNPNNGIALTATLDALFDRHLISFDEHGEMIISSAIPTSERKRLGLGVRLNLPASKERYEFLQHHRKNFVTKSMKL